jgi:hypothetical protein
MVRRWGRLTISATRRRDCNGTAIDDDFAISRRCEAVPPRIMGAHDRRRSLRPQCRLLAAMIAASNSNSLAVHRSSPAWRGRVPTANIPQWAPSHRTPEGEAGVLRVRKASGVNVAFHWVPPGNGTQWPASYQPDRQSGESAEARGHFSTITIYSRIFHTVWTDMPSDIEGKDFAYAGNDFAGNAGFALDFLVAQRIAEQHRDKAVARMFGVSLRMAKYLRQGKHWTVDRLRMASALLGRDFDVLVIVPLSSGIEPEEIHDRIDAVENQIEREIEQLRSEVQDGFYQIMRFLGALIHSEAGPAAIAQGGAGPQKVVAE